MNEGGGGAKPQLKGYKINTDAFNNCMKIAPTPLYSFKTSKWSPPTFHSSLIQNQLKQLTNYFLLPLFRTRLQVYLQNRIQFNHSQFILRVGIRIAALFLLVNTAPLLRRRDRTRLPLGANSAPFRRRFITRLNLENGLEIGTTTRLRIQENERFSKSNPFKIFEYAHTFQVLLVGI